MIKVPIHLLNNLLISLQSKSINGFSNSKFIRIEDVECIEKLIGKHILPHHAICLVTRERTNKTLFSCIYLVDMSILEVRGICKIKTYWKGMRYFWDIRKESIGIELHNPVMHFKYIWVTYIGGKY